MKCKISCSFGDVVDKITILKIKSKKIKDKLALENVYFELQTIQRENPDADKNDNLFCELQKINNKLWILEDLIREKSKKQQFDEGYIKIAESIHKTNDERCRVKKLINIKYKSNIIEEKSFSTNTYPNIEDVDNLEKGKRLYTNGLYNESFLELSMLVDKFQNYNLFDSFYIDLMFAYKNISHVFNIENKHSDKLDYIIENLNKLDILPELKEYCKRQYSSHCLLKKKYINNFNNYINYISGPNVNYNNMSFFKENDVNKTLLIYDGGGIGDKFMVSRFIPLLCEKYKSNKIIFFLNEHICWFFNDCFKDIYNLEIISYSNPNLLSHFDYHCNLLSLLTHLKINYNDILFSPLFKDINYQYKDNHKKIIDSIIESNKKTYIFNWKGNSKNCHELSNRRMELTNAIPLFKLPNINWVVITKDITKNEHNILKKNGVFYYGDILDNGANCFEDSVSIIKHVDGVFSTDTSLVHLSANLDIKTYALLTLGCEWRWTQNDEFTTWYPNMILLRQTKFDDWSNVINSILNLFKN
tara:strand:+ start:76 stop:1665 length:1590 start_codon:yes stop_codon:yes gene_type:complete